MNPPLRTAKDLQIIEGLADGTIDLIATDHAPHSMEEKNKPSCQKHQAESLVLRLLCTWHHKSCKTWAPDSVTASENDGQSGKAYHLPYGQIKEAVPLIWLSLIRKNAETQGQPKSCNTSLSDRNFSKSKYTICGGKTVYSDK